MNWYSVLNVLKYQKSKKKLFSGKNRQQEIQGNDNVIWIKFFV
jgi:hypothetical protein